VLVLVGGLSIVNTHNRWVADWPVIVTVFGWAMVVGGAARVAVPRMVTKIGGATQQPGDAGSGPGLRHTGFGEEDARTPDHASRGTEHDEAAQCDRWTHHPARRLCDQPAKPEASRGSVWLVEDRRSATQDAFSRT